MRSNGSYRTRPEQDSGGRTRDWEWTSNSEWYGCLSGLERQRTNICPRSFGRGYVSGGYQVQPAPSQRCKKGAHRTHQGRAMLACNIVSWNEELDVGSFEFYERVIKSAGGWAGSRSKIWVSLYHQKNQISSRECKPSCNLLSLHLSITITTTFFSK